MITPALSARRAQGARELRGRSVSDLEVILAFLETTVARQGAVRDAYASLTESRATTDPA